MPILASINTEGDSITSTFPLNYKDGIPYLTFLGLPEGRILLIQLDPNKILPPSDLQPEYSSYQGSIQPADHQAKIEQKDYFD